jgi:hypothetical protein
MSYEGTPWAHAPMATDRPRNHDGVPAEQFWGPAGNALCHEFLALMHRRGVTGTRFVERGRAQLFGFVPGPMKVVWEVGAFCIGHFNHVDGPYYTPGPVAYLCTDALVRALDGDGNLTYPPLDRRGRVITPEIGEWYQPTETIPNPAFDPNRPGVPREVYRFPRAFRVETLESALQRLAVDLLNHR